MKIKHELGAASLTHEGQSFEADENGYIDAPFELAQLLLVQTEWTAEEPREVGTTDIHSALFDAGAEAEAARLEAEEAAAAAKALEDAEASEAAEAEAAAAEAKAAEEAEAAKAEDAQSKAKAAVAAKLKAAAAAKAKTPNK